MMLHGYQIENVVGVIEGVKNEQPLEILLKGLDPLGYFLSSRISEQSKVMIMQLFISKCSWISPLEATSENSWIPSQ